MTSLQAARTPPLVLVVDDDAAMRFLAEEALEQAGYVVAHASNGREAIALLQETIPDLVLLDIKMPVMDGFSACEEIRCLPGGSRVPVVMMTGLDDLGSIERAYELGATDFVTKPINYHILTHRVRYILRSAQTAEMLRRRDAELSRAQQVARFGHYKWDMASRTMLMSPAAADVLGIDAGRGCWHLDEVLELVHHEDRPLVRGTLEHCLDAPRSYQFDHRLLDANEAERCVRHEAEVDLDDRGEVRQIIGIVRDVTAQRQAQARVHYLAYYDSLTELPNRALVKELLRNVLVSAQRRGHCAAVLFCDLDNFKQVNDTFGYECGDQILKLVASRLRDCIRCGTAVKTEGTDPDTETHRVRDIVSRIGGDDFVVVLTEVRRAEDTVKAVQRIKEAFARPFDMAGQRITITLSVGISIYPQDGVEIDTLLRNADAAMYQAKRSGRDSCQFYTNSINARAAKRFSLETALRQALSQNEFELHYQPKIGLQQRGILGFEALVRWRNSEGKLISPVEFIPVAEETGLIVPIGQWVLNTACRQIRDWQEHVNPDLTMAVNLSARQFRNPDLVEGILGAIGESCLKPESLELELTESLLMEDTEHCVTLMHSIREMGSRLAIDDFGTGYSSLGYLKRFPINTFKIDRTFIRDLEHDNRDASIVSAMILMAHELGLEVVAEGVESEVQAEFLRKIRCDAAQGFLFARPMPAQECEAWLTRKQSEDDAVAGSDVPVAAGPDRFRS